MPETPTEYAKWKAEIERALRADRYKDFCEKGDKAQDRYRDARDKMRDSRSGQQANFKRYNILWSNVQTLKPALFSRVPEPQVLRQFKDQDPIGRTAAQLLERCMQTDLEADDIEDVLDRSVEDYLISGRGVAVVNYSPDLEENRIEVFRNQERTGFVDGDGNEVGEKIEVITEGRGRGTKHHFVDTEVKGEGAPIRYVYWKDVLHADCKTWKELQRRGWIAFREEWTKKEARDRFGKEKADKLSAADPKKDQKEKVHPVYEVWQVWDAVGREVLWISMSYEEFLDRETDPLGLDGFFPTPRFLSATTTNDCLIPVADYTEYWSQAIQLDELTQRISILYDSIKIAGVYDNAFPALATLMKMENKLVGVDNWAATGQGGIGEHISLFPIAEIAAVLIQLTEAREQVKRDLYEITGLADVLRGQSDPLDAQETNRLKGKFGMMRISQRQREVQRYIKDLYQLKAEVIVRHFDDETILQKASWAQSTEMQIPQPTNQEEILAAERAQLENMQNTKAALALLRKDEMATFRLDVETDATIAVDDEEERQSRIAFVSMLSEFMTTAIQAGKENPALAPLLGQVLLFAIRGWKVGRELESFIEDALEKLRTEPPAEPPPDPAVLEVQRRAKDDEMQHQINQGKLAAQAAELNLEWQKFIAENELAMEESQRENIRLIGEGIQALLGNGQAGPVIVPQQQSGAKVIDFALPSGRTGRALVQDVQ